MIEKLTWVDLFVPVMCFLKEKLLNLTRKLYAFKVVSVNIVTCYGSIDLRTSSDLSKRDFIKKHSWNHYIT